MNTNARSAGNQVYYTKVCFVRCKIRQCNSDELN